MNYDELMQRAIGLAETARLRTPPNPWVGAVLVTADGHIFDGATEPPGQRHAEIVALDKARAAGSDTRDATMVTTLEPCSHTGRTGPCCDALIAAGVSNVVSAITDPDSNVGGTGFSRLRAAGIHVIEGVGESEVRHQLRAYLHHRMSGRPFVVLKMASTLDGRTAAADGSSRWITGEIARIAVHQMRAESGAVIVGAGTVRADDPELTVRHLDAPSPRRVVLGRAPSDAKVHPCTEWSGDLTNLLETLGRDGVLQVLVEGGPTVANNFHSQGLVDRYVIHLAPALMGGDDGFPIFRGFGASDIGHLSRLKIESVRRLGDDLEVVLEKEAQ